MNVQEFAELAAGYVLGALSGEDREAFESALAEHPEWRGILDQDAATAAALADSVAPISPPLAMRGTLLSQIMTMPQGDAVTPPVDAPTVAIPPVPPLPLSVPPVPPLPPMPPLPDEGSVAAVEPEALTEPETTRSDPDTGESALDLLEPPPTEAVKLPEPPPTTSTIQTVARRRWTRGLLTLAASLVLLVSLGYGAASLNQWVNRPPAVVALQEIEASADGQSATVELTDGAGVATAHWSGSLGTAVLVADGLPRVASDQTFELWFVHADGTPVSAGTFEASGESTTALLDGDMQAGDTIAVTIEPAGGSPTGTPSTDPIVAIPTA